MLSGECIEEDEIPDYPDEVTLKPATGQRTSAVSSASAPVSGAAAAAGSTGTPPGLPIPKSSGTKGKPKPPQAPPPQVKAKAVPSAQPKEDNDEEMSIAEKIPGMG